MTADDLALPGLLQQLEEEWRAQGAPLASFVAPGATSEELEECEAGVGLPLSAEVRQWWSWHNGTLPGARFGALSTGPGGWELMFLAEARADRDEWVATMPQYDLPWGST